MRYELVFYAWWLVFDYCKWVIMEIAPETAANIVSVYDLKVCNVLWGMNAGNIKSQITQWTLTTAFLSSPVRTSFPWKEDNIVRQDPSTTPSAELAQVSRLQWGQRDRKVLKRTTGTAQCVRRWTCLDSRTLGWKWNNDYEVKML